jgi:hypothetical protein
MDCVYVVQHAYEHSNGAEEVKFISVYESQEQAHAAVERTRRLPGFSDIPDSFSIDRYQIGKDHWTDGFLTWTPEGDGLE